MTTRARTAADQLVRLTRLIVRTGEPPTEPHAAPRTLRHNGAELTGPEQAVFRRLLRGDYDDHLAGLLQLPLPAIRNHRAALRQDFGLPPTPPPADGTVPKATSAPPATATPPSGTPPEPPAPDTLVEATALESAPAEAVTPSDVRPESPGTTTSAHDRAADTMASAEARSMTTDAPRPVTPAASETATRGNAPAEAGEPDSVRPEPPNAATSPCDDAPATTPGTAHRVTGPRARRGVRRRVVRRRVVAGVGAGVGLLALGAGAAISERGQGQVAPEAPRVRGTVEPAGPLGVFGVAERPGPVPPRAPMPSGVATATSFWDRETASMLKMSYQTVASPYWPLGTIVRISYRKTAAVGIVEDFGPARWAVAQHDIPAIIDISEKMMADLTGSRRNAVHVRFSVVQWGSGPTFQGTGPGYALATGGR